MRKVFTKLGITSRSQLDRVRPGAPAAVRRQPVLAGSVSAWPARLVFRVCWLIARPEV